MKLSHDDPDTIQKWRNALSSSAEVSGFELDGAKFNGDEIWIKSSNIW
jgi:hypothetical protein